MRLKFRIYRTEEVNELVFDYETRNIQENKRHEKLGIFLVPP